MSKFIPWAAGKAGKFADRIRFQTLTIFSVALLLVVAFQNCSPSGFETSFSSLQPEDSSGIKIAPPNLEFFGRVVTSGAPDYFGKDYGQGQNQATFTGAGTAIRATFSGSSLQVAMNTSSAYTIYFVAIVDGGTPLRFPLKNGTFVYPIASSLATGNHEVLLMRDSEGQLGVSQFLGFKFSATGILLPPTVHPRGLKIEVIGDSITCGYGNLGVYDTPGNLPNCDPVVNESAYNSYAQITARSLGSTPAMQVCQAGIGTVRYSQVPLGTDSANAMPAFYQLTYNPLVTAGPNWIFPLARADQPDVVVIDLGTNDGWDGNVPANLISTYTAFVQTIRQHYPNAQIIATLGPMSYVTSSAVSQAVQNLRNSGDTKVSYLQFAAMNLTNGVGCASHPNLLTDNLMAAQLTMQIQTLRVQQETTSSE